MSSEYTVTIGTRKNADELLHALEDAGCEITGATREILSRIDVSPKTTQLDLAVVTVEELGLRERVTRKEIYDRAQKRDLRLCPAETGPELWLQHKDQIQEPQLFIGMEPLIAGSAEFHLLQVGRYGPNVFLRTWDGAADEVFYAGQSWVFQRGPTDAAEEPARERDAESHDDAARRSLLDRLLGR